MSQSIDTTVQQLKRRVRLWRRIAAAFVVLTAVAWVGVVPGPRPVEAQQPRSNRANPSSRPHMEYHQAEAVYTRTAEVIGEWEGKGWETFQVVPVFPANPGLGRPMTVAIVFRRPTK
jgi:hypothetical protein